MYYCIATVRSFKNNTISEYTITSRGDSKGDALKKITDSGKGNIIWLEELTEEDFNEYNKDWGFLKGE